MEQRGHVIVVGPTYFCSLPFPLGCNQTTPRSICRGSIVALRTTIKVEITSSEQGTTCVICRGPLFRYPRRLLTCGEGILKGITLHLHIRDLAAYQRCSTRGRDVWRWTDGPSGHPLQERSSFTIDWSKSPLIGHVECRLAFYLSRRLVTIGLETRPARVRYEISVWAASSKLQPSSHEILHTLHSKACHAHPSILPCKWAETLVLTGRPTRQIRPFLAQQ